MLLIGAVREPHQRLPDVCPGRRQLRALREHGDNKHNDNTHNHHHHNDNYDNNTGIFITSMCIIMLMIIISSSNTISYTLCIIVAISMVAIAKHVTNHNCINTNTTNY